VARNRKLRVRGVRKERPDIRRLSRAIIELAQARAEAEAQAAHRQPTDRSSSPANPATSDTNPADSAADGHGEPV
jgi:hypothetical protein